MEDQIAVLEMRLSVSDNVSANNATEQSPHLMPATSTVHSLRASPTSPNRRQQPTPEMVQKLESQIEELIRENASLKQRQRRQSSKITELEHLSKLVQQSEQSSLDQLKDQMEQLKRVNSQLLEENLELKQHEKEWNVHEMDSKELVHVIDELTMANDRLMADKQHFESLLEDANRQLKELKQEQQPGVVMDTTPIPVSAHRQSLFGELASSLMKQAQEMENGIDRGESPTPAAHLTSPILDTAVRRLSLNEDRVMSPMSQRSTLTAALERQQSDLNQFESPLANQTQQLTLVIHHYAQRLTHTSPLALNRRLRMQFDISYLTGLSERILLNLDNEISDLPKRFHLEATLWDQMFEKHVQAIVKLLRDAIELRREGNAIKEGFAKKLEEWSEKEIQSLLRQPLAKPVQVPLAGDSRGKTPLKRQTSLRSFSGSPVVEATRQFLKKHAKSGST